MGARRRGRWGGAAVAAAVTLVAADAAADPVAFELPGARLLYGGLESSFRVAKTKSGEAAPMLAIGPNAELHFTPRWSVELHGAYAFGLGSVIPDVWWEVGLRGVWRPLPAQALGLGLSLARANESRRRFEDVGPQLDLGGAIWEFDADPIRFGPIARVAVTLHEGSAYAALGIYGQWGVGPARTKDPDSLME
jgi:hypothetical protein